MRQVLPFALAAVLAMAASARAAERLGVGEHGQTTEEVLTCKNWQDFKRVIDMQHTPIGPGNISFAQKHCEIWNPKVVVRVEKVRTLQGRQVVCARPEASDHCSWTVPTAIGNPPEE